MFLQPSCRSLTPLILSINQLKQSPIPHTPPDQVTLPSARLAIHAISSNQSSAQQLLNNAHIRDRKTAHRKTGQHPRQGRPRAANTFEIQTEARTTEAKRVRLFVRSGSWWEGYRSDQAAGINIGANALL